GRSTLSERLKSPAELPGADAPPLELPSMESEERGSAIDALFPGLPPLVAEFRVEGAADQPQLTLADLERLALDNNPTIVQASADIEAAAGAAIQAGAYPNPVVGYEADTVGSAGTRNYQGVFIEQEIKTAGKLDLARSIATVDLMNKQLGLRKSRADLLRKVRSNYFAALVARENLRYSTALVRFTNEVYRVQVEQLKGGQAAAYEPMQLRALAVQARGAFAQARNRYVSAWKQLAAALGEPDLPATALAGRVDLPYHPVDFEAAISHMLTYNSDMLAARNLEFQKRLELRLAEVIPIPNINLYTAIQKDFTTPPVSRTTYNVQLGVPVPIFNRNRGGIQQARGELVRASEEMNRVRLDLTAQLADAFERYETNRTLLEYYRDRILPDFARVYRGVYERHQQESDQVVFGDIIVAQQFLQTSIATYVVAMNAQWTAYADITALLQLEDLSQLPLAESGPSAVGLEPLVLPPVDVPPAPDAEPGNP
ncbi:MAG: TolC family protein, partial [Planctomycetaceae bacterium]